jgi:dihydrofolate reductase
MKAVCRNGREGAMAKLVLSVFISLDGYTEMPGGVFTPPEWSDDMEQWALASTSAAGHLLYGRVNFLFNKDFWSAAETDPTSPAAGISYAGRMNSLPKTVVSTTLTGDPGWNGRIVSGDLVGAVAKLKAEVEGDIYSYGGAGLANSLMALDLVDEYRILVIPRLFGDGKRLFGGGLPQIGLKLVETKTLDTGAVSLRYHRNHQA